MISESDAVAMFEGRVISYVNKNTGQWIKSPRDKAFGKSITQKIRISLKEPDRIRFEFESGRTTLNFEYWRFMEAIKCIYKNKNPVIIGDLHTANCLQSHISEIAKKRNKTESDLRCARHIADLLVLSDIAEYTYIKPLKGQRIQGIKQKELHSEY